MRKLPNTMKIVDFHRGRGNREIFVYATLIDGRNNNVLIKASLDQQ